MVKAVCAGTFLCFPRACFEDAQRVKPGLEEHGGGRGPRVSRQVDFLPPNFDCYLPETFDTLAG